MSHSYTTTPSSSGINCVQVLNTPNEAPHNATSNNAVNSNQILSTGAYSLQSGDIVVTSTSAPANLKETKKSKNQRVAAPRKPPPTIDNFWQNIMAEVRGIEVVDAKHQALPLARIKKIMKLDENAKMIAAEAPLLFAKACEYFIQELTMRAWVHTEESKRRTLQRSDIAQAIAGYDQFDFLIDIVPREDIKPSSSSGYKKESQYNNTSNTSSAAPAAAAAVVALPVKMENAAGEVLTFGTLTADALAQAAAAANQQHHAQATIVNNQPQFQIIQQPSSTHPNQMNYFIVPQPQDHLGTVTHGQSTAQPQQLQIIQQAAQPQYYITTHQPQQLILTTGPNGQLTATPAPANAAHQQQATILQSLAHHQQQQQAQPHIQLLQQVVTPTGEVTNVPIAINANQLNLLRLQMQPGATQQLLQLNTNSTAPVTTSHTVTAAQLQQAQHQQQQQQQHHHANTGAANIFISATPHVTAAQVHNQQQQQQQQQHQQQQHQQQQQQPQLINLTNASIVATDRTLGSNFRSNC
ncbi:nuclear transcription factor Y subunit gamma [Eurosta solidaginis]|uniref:nuclear transcription factor Y subunit gamma n=1 Tax=Eurosta solidaginis TaxID=178769 RepID=UPI0035307F14